MNLTVALVVLGAAAFVSVTVFATVAQRRRAARARRRRDALAEVAARIDAAVSSLGELTVIRSFDALAAPPDPTDPASLVEADLAGRAGLLQAIAAGVAAARSQGQRLAAAVVRAEEGDAATLARGARSVLDVPVYAVGPRAVALVLPGLGRADALGVLARIEAQCPSSGRAVELESGEDAVELAARLLGGQAPHGA